MKRIRPLYALGIIIFLITATSCACALEQKKNEAISVKANKAITYPDKKILVFSGNVRAVRGETIINADELKVFYKSAKSMNKKLEASSFKKVEAIGNVKITMEDKTALAEKAEFLPEEQKLVLSGGRPVITDKDGKVEGDIVIYDMETGGMEVMQDSGKQIEATFISK